MKRVFVLCAVLPFALSSAVIAAQVPPVSVYVTSVGAVQGLTDPSKDNRDTVKDLRESLADYKKELVLVDTPEAAQIILIVQSRQTSDVTAGFLGDPARDRTIRVTFKAGAIETGLQASAQGGTLGSGGAWSKAAAKIAKQVREWVMTNRVQLDEASR
jgi:hypothetical protein